MDGFACEKLPITASFNFLTSFVIPHNLKKRIICSTAATILIIAKTTSIIYYLFFYIYLAAKHINTLYIPYISAIGTSKSANFGSGLMECQT